ncbi:uncharacterized protein METZ01_LOCUS336822, partial [marine metagenome]
QIRDLSIELINRFPNEIFFYNILAASLNELGLKEESFISYKKALEKFPDASDLHYNLGNLYLERNDIIEATNCYNIAINLNSKNIAAKFNLSKILTSKEEFYRAKQLLEDILQFDPENHQALNNLGNLNKKIGNLRKSRELLEKSIRIYKDSEIYYINLAAVLRELNENERAIQSCLKALKIKPESKEAFYNLAICYKETGQTDKALETFKKAEIEDSLERYVYELYVSKRFEEFQREFYSIKNNYPKSSLLQALSNHASIVYDKDLNYNFCNFGLKYIYKINLKNIIKDHDNLRRNLIKEINKYSSNHKDQKLITNGSQTSGNIFLEKSEN